MNLKAIYRPVPTSSATQQETLIYNLPSGFAWVMTNDIDNHWHCYSETVVGAEQAAIKAGFNPVAVAYIDERVEC